MRDPINPRTDMVQAFIRAGQRKADVIDAARKVDDEWANGCLAYSDLKALHDALGRLDDNEAP